MDTDSKVPGVLDLGHFMPKLREMSGYSNDSVDVLESIDEIKEKRRERFSREAIRHHVDLKEEEELRELIAKEEREVMNLKRDGLTPNEIFLRRTQSPTSKRIKQLLQIFGIAKLNTSGDWIVNRKSEIPEAMGVIPFKDIMELQKHFNWIYDKKGRKALVALDLGCGNGEFCEELRAESDQDVNQPWEIYGYADRIYFTLQDFLRNLIRKEFGDDDALDEFIQVVSTLLLRELHEIEAYSGHKTYEQDVLRSLPFNLGVIRPILQDLQKYIDIKGKHSIRVDLEFLSDAEREISVECRELIDAYIQDPKEFVSFYFKEVVQDLSPEEKNRLQGITAEMNVIKKSLDRVTRSLTRKIGKIDVNERKKHEDEIKEEMRSRARRSTLVENRKKINALKKERNRIMRKIPDLAPYISLYHYNVIPGSFDDLENIIPDQAVNFMWAFRSTSHLDNADYIGTIKDAATKLAPGGIFLDDGKRESWTRYERIEELDRLQDELGSEFSVRLIVKDGKPTAVLIERVLDSELSGKIFFSDKFGEEMLKEGSEIIDVHEWVTKMPSMYIRNKVIEVVRDAFVDATYEGLRGRMFFKGVHPVIEKGIDYVEQNVDYDVSQIEEVAEKLQRSVIRILEQKGGPVIKELLAQRVKPRKEKDTISTLSRTQEIPMNGINRMRFFNVTDLPRNRDIPPKEALQMREFALVQGLSLLRQAIDRPPITVCEFDDCFTNKLMIDLLHNVLDSACFTYGVDFDDLVRIYNIKLRGDHYAQSSTLGVVNIIGGSTGNVYDEYGKRFTDHFVRPLMDEIAIGTPARFIGVCFGSQSILQAFGQQHNLPFNTAPGALQYGAFPVSFTGNKRSFLKELSGASYTVSMTRESYSLVDGYDELSNDLIAPLAFEYSKFNGRMQVDKELPPVAFSLYGGKVITTQFHPEISLKAPESHGEMNAWLDQNHQYLKQEFGEKGRTLPRHFDIKALSDSGIINWVEKDIGPFFMLNVLSRQIETLLTDLSLR